jgi:formyl-CoA transferase
MPEASDNSQILAGIRVIDLSRYLSGPQSTLFLAALGAEVIRIDHPTIDDATADAPPFFGPRGVCLQRRTPDDLGIAHLKRARGKKAITLNLKCDEGRELFFRLIDHADVLVENFRVGVMERLGIAYAALHERNPRLIHCAITGYGSTGPDRALKAYDLMVQASTGLMSITGDADGLPFKAGSPLSDGIAGTFAVAGVVSALFHRERNGKGQFIDVSMADCLVSLILDEPFDCYEELGLPLRQGNRIMRFSPFNTYRTRDGTVAIGVATGEDWIALLEVMDRGDLLTSDQFMNPSWRIANNSEVDGVVAAWVVNIDTATALERLMAREIPCSVIRDVRDVATWPHLHERGMLQKVQHPGCPNLAGPLAPAFALKFSSAPTGYAAPAALRGQHNGEIYGGLLGMSEQELSKLTSSGVI